jgi:N-methylhydantoinase B
MTAALDPVTYQVLRHRLWAVNVEAALALQRVSGSPLATEAFDMNTSIMTKDGEVVFVGPYLLTGPMSQGMIVRNILTEYSDNPGIGPDDIFLCNDPYSGAVHQNCVTLVGPITVGERRIGWAGATLHVIDVGGPQAGQVGVGARSIFEEAPVTPPLKIFTDRRLLKDVESEYLRRSRTPELNALDLRAKIAAISTIRRRVGELAERYGVETIDECLERTITDAARRLRRRLSELEDYQTSHTAYLDESLGTKRRFYAVRCTLVKVGADLKLDFNQSSPQAGAVLNCTESGLRSGALIAVLVSLGQGDDWCPAAFERVVEIQSTPGTVVNASWPAGCSMATMAGGFATTTAAAVCLARMLAQSAATRGLAMSTWSGATGAVDVFGIDQRGERFGTVLLDTMAGGAGARKSKDGIDTGGFLRSMACVITNVEQYEARYPILYLYRRQETDTGGPGVFRGGTGIGYGLIAHKTDRIERVNPHFSGSDQPESVGIAGGYPGGANRVEVARNTDVRKMMAMGKVPDATQFDGSKRGLPGVAVVELGPDDALLVAASGGGGWGDPIRRDPGMVQRDVREGLVSAEWARRVYGVELDEGIVDGRRTASRRSRIRSARRRAAQRDVSRTGSFAGDLAELEVTSCPACGLSGGMLERRLATRRLGIAGPIAGNSAAFELVEIYCGSCWCLLAVDRGPVRGVDVA